MTGAAWLGGISPSRKTSSSAALGWRSPRSPPLAIRPLPKRKRCPAIVSQFSPTVARRVAPPDRIASPQGAVPSSRSLAVGIDHPAPVDRRGLLRIGGAVRAHGHQGRGAPLVRAAKV